MLGAPLTNLARLTVRTEEISLHFARRLQKYIYSLFKDLILNVQVTDFLRNYIQQSLPKTRTIIHREIRDMANDELSDYMVQVTKGVGRWTLEDEAFKKQYLQIPSLVKSMIMMMRWVN